MSLAKKIDVFFFKSATGGEPVREWMQGLLKIDKKIIGEDILTVQYGWPIGMPLIDSLGGGLWEVRSKLSNRKISRVIFFMHNDSIVLLHAFIKKTQKTPKHELDLAKTRKKEYINS